MRFVPHHILLAMNISKTNYCIGAFYVWLIVTGFALAVFQSIGVPSVVTLFAGCTIASVFSFGAWRRWPDDIFRHILPPLRNRFRRAMFFIGLANVFVTIGLMAIAADIIFPGNGADSYAAAIPFVLLIALPGYIDFFTARACLDATMNYER